MIVDNHVVEVKRGTWHPDDDRADVAGSVIIGRGTVHIDGDRYCVDAFIVASADPRTLGARSVVFFDPESGRAVSLPMESL